MNFILLVRHEVIVKQTYFPSSFKQKGSLVDTQYIKTLRLPLSHYLYAHERDKKIQLIHNKYITKGMSINELNFNNVIGLHIFIPLYYHPFEPSQLPSNSFQLTTLPQHASELQQKNIEKVLSNEMEQGVDSVVKQEAKEDYSDYIVPLENNLNSSPKRSVGTKSVESNNSKTSRQKAGRNSNSTLLRIFFRTLQSKFKKSHKSLTNIIVQKKLKLTPSAFLEWFNASKVDYRSYIRASSARKLFVNSTSKKECSVIMRTLLKQFLDKQAVISLLTARKVNKGELSHLFKGIRAFKSDFFRVQSDQ